VKRKEKWSWSLPVTLSRSPGRADRGSSALFPKIASKGLIGVSSSSYRSFGMDSIAGHLTACEKIHFFFPRDLIALRATERR